MQKMRLLFWLLFVLSLGAASAFGQVATGTPPFGTYGGGPDVLNLANLNAHLDVPVLNKPGRGMPFTYDLIYDTSVWTPVTSGSTKTWQPVSNWGWGATTQVATGILTASIIDTAPCYCTHNGIPYLCGHAYTWSNWAYLDKFGVSHPFAGTTYTGSTSCGISDPGFTNTTTDGSGYTLTAQGSSGTVTGRGGVLVLPQTNIGNGSATKTDTNGNQISVSSAGVFTDTLGTPALTVTGTAPSNTVFAYTPPAGGTAQYTMKYAAYNIQTNFNCSGIGQYSATNVSLVSEIDLPDGTKYSFAYEPTYGYSGSFTGRLASVTLPTGGTISYSYGTGGVNGINCADGSASTLTRTTPDGTWTYTHTESGTAWTTLVTDPTAQQNQTNISFQSIYETERDSYQGLKSANVLLKTVITCYNGNTSNCNSTAIALPIGQRTATLQWPVGKQTQVTTKYDQFGLLTETDEYDYGTPPLTVLRQTLITYWMPNPTTIWDRPAQVTVKDGLGNIKAQTTYQYDQYSVVATSGTPQHVAPPDPNGNRGNPTNASLLVGSTTLSLLFQYFDTGTRQYAYDVNGAQTTYIYGTGSCGNSFPTSISEPLNLSRSMIWDCTGGVTTSVTDENGNTTKTAYTPDPDFWRINSFTDTASNVASVAYTGAASVESSLVFNAGNSTVDALATVDGLGRAHVTQRKQSPSATNYDSVETDYDTMGRPNRVTQPYSGTAGQTNSSAPYTSTIYDPLSRPTQITDGGNGNVALSYTQNDVLNTLGPAPTGENTKRKQFEYDGLGRLTSVCEITSASGSGACSQTLPQTGFWTIYSSDVLGDLIGVTQNAQSGTKQTRSYNYDGLGRMTSETNPESATTQYFYDSDTTCGTYTGDLVKKVDAAGNVTCFAYDALHRPTNVIVSSGLYASVTPKKYLVYDGATLSGTAMANAKGRLAEAYTCFSPCSSKLTDEFFSYTVLGQISDTYQSTPHSSVYYHVTTTYWPNGAVKQLSNTNLTGLPTITYGVDGEGRPYSVSASSGQNPLVSTTSYNVASEPLQLNLGSSDSDAFQYDGNTGRMTQYKFIVNGQSMIGNLGWNPNGTLASLGITDPFNSADTQTCSYSHDDLVRIVSANCGTGWSQTFNYTADTTNAFGNLNKSGSSMFQPTYSPTTNRMTQIGSSTPTYDLNGDVLNDFVNQYAWDAAGRPITVDGVGMTYDALGRMVEQNRSGLYTEIVYAPTGSKLALMSGSTLQKAFIPLRAGSMAVYNSSGLAYYRHSDWLGSSRLASTPSRTIYSVTAYGAFGEPYAQAGTADASFTGQNQDTAPPTVYDFPAREYGIQGRWPSPDPAGLAAVTLTNPQTFNRYAYVTNNPLAATDPSGMRDCISNACLEGSGGGGEGGPGGWGGADDWAEGGSGFTFEGLPVSANFANGLSLADGGFSLTGQGGGGGSFLGSLLGSINPLSAILGQIIPGWGLIGSPIIDNYHADQNGNAVGDFPGEQLCLQPSPFGCRSNSVWNAQAGEWDSPCDDPPCLSDSQSATLGQAGAEAQAGVDAAMIATSPEYALALAPVAIEAAGTAIDVIATHPLEAFQFVQGFASGNGKVPPLTGSGIAGWITGRLFVSLTHP
jgi:RHS repeat-associated protein